MKTDNVKCNFADFTNSQSLFPFNSWDDRSWKSEYEEEREPDRFSGIEMKCVGSSRSFDVYTNDFIVKDKSSLAARTSSVLVNQVDFYRYQM